MLSDYKTYSAKWQCRHLLLFAIILVCDIDDCLNFSINLDLDHHSQIFEYPDHTVVIRYFEKSLQSELKERDFITMDKMQSNSSSLSIKWAHAVNDQQSLLDTLASDVNMIEADVILGKLNKKGNIIPVMAHPPLNYSDLPLDEFMEQILIQSSDESNGKGIKLDFKTIAAFQASMPTLVKTIPKIRYPVWLNADIIKGPVSNNASANHSDTEFAEEEALPVDADIFLSTCVSFKHAVISVGWTTLWNARKSNVSYSTEHINAMLEAIKRNNITANRTTHITFPVRAGIAANSGPILEELLNKVRKTNNCSLTIWSSKDDYVNVENLRSVIQSIGLDSIYVDVPDDLAQQLRLDTLEQFNQSNKFTPMLFIIVLTACAVFIDSLLRSNWA